MAGDESATEALFAAVQRCPRRSPQARLPYCGEWPIPEEGSCGEACSGDVRRAVKRYAERLRHLDIPPEHGLTILRDVLTVALPDIHRRSMLLTSVGPWLIEGYYSADTTLGD